MKGSLKNLFNLSLLMTALSTGAVVAAESKSENAEARGLAIAQERVNRNRGWNDVKVNMEMRLFSGGKNVATRQLVSQYLEVPHDGDKNLSVFQSPADIKNTRFLSHTHVDKSDDQWIFLPALQRTKRISSANKSGPFVGSEFSFEDLASFEVERYKFRYLNDAEVDGTPCYVLESYPTYEKSGYKRLESCIDKERYIPLQVKFFDKRDEHFKTLDLKGYNQYLGRYWRVSTMVMTNHQTGKHTELEWSGYQFQSGLGSADFDKRVLAN